MKYNHICLGPETGAESRQIQAPEVIIYAPKNPSLSPSLSLPHTQLSTGSLMASHDSITDCICLDLGVVLKEPAVHEGLGSVCVC